MMNLALNRGPLVVHATGAAECSFKILHRLTEGDALMQRVLILLDQSAELTLVEEFQGTPSDSLVLWNPVTEVVAEDNSSLNYVALRYYTDSEYHFHRFTSDQKRDSRIHYAVIHTGGALGKSFTVARIHDRDATFRGIGVAIGTGRQYNDAEMVVEHHADHTASSLLYKTVLKGRAHSVFNGNLVIPPGRRQVESIQMNYNILLDRKARAESMPKLVTRSENVSCEHGATVGELDEEAIFFLMARGLPHSEARDLLIQGFYSEVVEEIPLSGEEHQAIEAIIKERIDS
jgi:Fe-S cluster assembly scaffold protein SufB